MNDIQILLVEDNVNDAKLLEHELKNNKINFNILRVDEEDPFRKALREFSPDIVISDYTMPSFDGMRALKISKEFSPFLPFLIITGSLNEEIAVECMKAGADDYIIKEHIGKISPSILNALKKKEIIEEKRLAEKEILRWKERYEIVARTSGQVVYDYNIESGNIIWSGSIEGVLGYNNLELMEMKNRMELIHPEDRTTVEQHLKSAETAMNSYEIEYRFLHKEGKYLYIHDNGTFIPGLDRKAKNLIGMMQDITEQKIMQERLSKLNECFLKFGSDPVENINLLTVFCGMELNADHALYNKYSEGVLIPISEWNTPNESSERDLAEESFCYELIRSGNLEVKVIRNLQQNQFVKKGQNIHWSKMKTFYGKAINFRSHPVGTLCITFNQERLPDKDELKLIEIIASAIGIEEERKHSLEEVHKLTMAMEQSPVMILLTDLNGDIQYVNSKFTQVTGFNLNEVKGKNPDFLRPGLLPKEEYDKIWPKILGGEVWNGEFLNKKKNGEFFWDKAMVSPIKNSNGNISNFLIITEDVTQRKNAEQELVRAKEQAEKSEQLKSEFLAQMSHEIRTPLNTILSFTSLLKEEFFNKSDENIKKSFQIINNGGRRIIRTIDLLLNMAQLQTGNFENNPVNVDLDKDIIENVILDFILVIKEKNLKINFHNHDVKEAIHADKFMVYQIFSNLVDNAIKYTENGNIEINLFKSESGKIAVEVKDTGIGISEEYLPQLFKPFTQEESGYTRKFEGNGLGLALVKKYVELCNASIDVQSIKGEGSSFIVAFNKIAEPVKS